MIKLTKRKGFNFYRSYYDVYNELETIEDKIAFIDALLDRQFLGIKPTNLIGMAKFAYISQTNAIDSQVKGYEDKTKTILTPTQGGSVGGSEPPCLQEKEKEKEKVKEKEDSKSSLETRSLAFKETLRPFISKYGVDMVKNFYGYWSEPNQTKRKMKYELEKTWDTSRRLETWSKRENNFFYSKQEVKPKNLGI
jgi:hypothetical protein